jgi:hypothetical protein
MSKWDIVLHLPEAI